jgi:hypothetical protein
MGYLVSIDYRTAPQKVHPTFGAALTEAVRLSSLPKHHLVNIRILEEVAVLRPGVGALSRLHIQNPQTLVSVGVLMDLLKQ